MIEIIKFLKENIWLPFILVIAVLIAYIIMREGYVAELELGNSNYKVENAIAKEQLKKTRAEEKELKEALKLTQDTILQLKDELKNLPKDEDIPKTDILNANDSWQSYSRAIEMADDSTFFDF